MRPSDSLVPFGPGFGRPSPRAYSACEGLFFAESPLPPQTDARRGCYPGPRKPGVSPRGTRASQVPGSSSYCVPRSSTPPGAPTPGPLPGWTLLPSGLGTPWAPGFRFSWLSPPRPTVSRTYASPGQLPASAQGSLPTCRAQLWSGRFRTYWTTYRISRVFDSPFLSDQPFLVALRDPDTDRGAVIPEVRKSGPSLSSTLSSSLSYRNDGHYSSLLQDALRRTVTYKELGESFLDHLDRTRVAGNLVRRLQNMGYEVDLKRAAEPAATAAG
jgi:hypothetical protein